MWHQQAAALLRSSERVKTFRRATSGGSGCTGTTRNDAAVFAAQQCVGAMWRNRPRRGASPDEDVQRLIDGRRAVARVRPGDGHAAWRHAAHHHPVARRRDPAPASPPAPRASAGPTICSSARGRPRSAAATLSSHAPASASRRCARPGRWLCPAGRSRRWSAFMTLGAGAPALAQPRAGPIWSGVDQGPTAARRGWARRRGNGRRQRWRADRQRAAAQGEREDDDSVSRQHRRAHQRHRLQGLRAHDPRRPVRGGAVGGAPAGRERRAGHRHQHGRGHARQPRPRWCAS